MRILDVLGRASRTFRTNYARALTCLLFLVVVPSAQAALTVSASSIVDPVRPAEYLQVEITVANTDGVARSGVVLEMTYPANLDQLFETAFDGDCAGTSCSNGELVTWTLGSIAAGATVTVSFPALVTNVAPNGAVIALSPTVTDGNLDSDSTTLNLEVQTDAKYDLSLSENSDPAVASALLTYKLTYGYRADAGSVNNSTLRFPIPANSTFVSATGGGVFSAGNVDWSLGFMGLGDGGVREVTVQLGAGLVAGDIVSASAEIFAVSTPTENAIAQANTTIAAATGLQLAIESNTNPARLAEIPHLQLAVRNTDAFTRFGVTLTATYPQDLSQVFETEFEGDCSGTSCSVGEFVTWTLGDIPAGGVVTVNMPPLISNIATGGVLINLMATATDTAGLQTRQTETIRLETDATYDLSIAEDSDPATAGSDLTYKLTYSSRADSGATNNSVLSLPLPAGTTFVSATGGGVVNNGVIEWSLGFLAPGEGGVREATVILDSGLSASTVIEAVAELTSLTAAERAVRAEANTVIAASRGLQLALQSNASPARDSEYLNLQLTVTNTDAFSRFGVDITGIYPQDLNQLFETEFDGNCSSTTCNPGELMTWTIGTIAAGETVTVPMGSPLVSNIATGGSLINFFMAAKDDQGLQTRQLDTFRVQTDTIYDLALSEMSDPVTAGSSLSYKLAYGYRADAGAANDSVLRLPLPAGATFVSATGGGVVNSGVIEWPLGFLSPGDGGVRQATVSLSGGLAAGTIVEAAAEISSVSSPIEHARAEANTVIAASNPLQLAIETTFEPVRPSELVNYRLTVTNTDPFTRFGVQLTGQYPQWLNQAFETAFEGDCSSTTCSVPERITWLLGDIPAGDSKTVDLPPVVATNATDGVLINLHASAQDDQGLQTRQMDTLTVQSDTLYDLAVTDSSDPATPGSMLTYKLTYGYREDAGAANQSLMRLQIPDGATFVSATGGGIHSNGNVDWALGVLDPGDGGYWEATVMVDPLLAPGTALEAVADVFSSASPDEGARAETITSIRGTTSLSLDVDAVVFTAEENRQLDMQLTVTNNDAFPRFGVDLKARFPQDVNQLFESNPDFDGDCASTTCNTNEIVTWPLVDIQAGQSVTVTLPPTPAAPFVDGRLINFLAWVEDDTGVQARGTESVYSGCIIKLDLDCDGIRDNLSIRGDNDDDDKSDILFRNNVTGANQLYIMDGTTISQNLAVSSVPATWQAVGRGDYDGDGSSDILWRFTPTGALWIYFMNGSVVTSSEFVGTISDSNWKVAASGDYNGDGKSDILWYNVASGTVWLYEMDGSSVATSTGIGVVPNLDWTIVGSGDYNADARSDILWRNVVSGTNWMYLMDGATIATSVGISVAPDTDWEIVGSGDYNGDFKSDILWRNASSGTNWLYLMDGTTIMVSSGISVLPDNNWKIVGDGDYNGDGTSDVLWRNMATGANRIYLMNGLVITTNDAVSTVTDQDWQIVNTN